MKKGLSILLSLVMLLSIFTVIPASAKEVDVAGTGAVKTRDEAVAWLRSQDGAKYDFGNFTDIYGRYWYGTQCVEFVRAYVNWVNTGDPWSDTWHRPTGNGGEIYKNSLWGELGWSVLWNSADLVPQPGDIFDAPGHTGVVISSDAHTALIAEANSRNYDPCDGDPVWVHQINWRNNGENHSHAAHHYIRPVFRSIVVPPAAPGSVNLNSRDLGKSDTLVANWGGVSGATAYDAKLICSTNSANNQTKSNLGGTSVSFKLTQAGTYYVAVRAKNSAGASAERNSATAVVHEDLTVNWVDYDDTVIKTQTVKYNGNAIAPAANPVREGYTFQGWDKSANNIKQDTTIKATYKINTYTVTFVDYTGSMIGGMQKVEYGSAATPPTDIPTKDGYVFVGWNTKDYETVKRNMTVTAVYEWGNTDLPNILHITSAVRNEEATGYHVKVKLTNFPNDFTKGKLIVALKTKEGKMVASETRSVSMPAEQEYTEDVLVLYSGVVSTVEVSMVGVLDDETTGTPKAKSVTAPIDIGNEWSDWSVNVPEGNDIISESRTEYRYKDHQVIKATSQPATPAGYTFEKSEKTGTYTNWSGWSGWTTAWHGNSTLKNVRTTTGYRYYAFVCPNCGTRDPFNTPGKANCSNCGYTGSLNWNEMYYETIGGNIHAGDAAGKGYVYINGTKWYYEYPGQSNGWNGTGQPTCTMYSYQTRQEYVNYFYVQSSFSAWQPDKVTSSSTRDVETRTTYRFKTNSTEVPCYNYKRYRYTNLNNGKTIYTYSAAYPDSMDYPGEWEYFKSFAQLALFSTVDGDIELYNGLGDKSWYKADLNNESESTVFETASTLEDTSGEKRHIEGTLENASNKVVTLIVYKGQNSDPTASQIEYAGQTVTDANGFYSFDFITKEEPSVKTGDFVITIGAEGSTNYMNIGKIDAPKPIYVVDFVTEDGTLIQEVSVAAGGTAEAPEAPEVEGYEFIGWDTALKNIQENTLVTAVYRQKTCVVVFVDWDDSYISMKEVPYGSMLTSDVMPERTGKFFAGWSEDGNLVTTVTQNMIVTARYDDARYIVKFLDADGNVLSEQTVDYGNAATVPEDAEAPSELQLFEGWDSKGAELFVTGNMEIRPVFKYIETSETPHLTLESGTYSDTQKLGIYSLSSAKLYYYVSDYDTEGFPDLNEVTFSEYKSPITISDSSIVYAYAESEGMNRSDYAIVALNIGEEQEEFILGDIDGDEEVSAIDVTYIMRYCSSIPVKFTEEEMMHGDVDGNEDLDVIDATFIQRHLAAIKTPYKIGELVKK
ncbi:InlB B-repeat-containing protein [uncultured Ruminococcus sp.]|uniref:InlB B-repeat-containing protein n=1 Tax=uncultured Ruminococcus sp. TaxID=165186 RepID=UPI00292D4E25|nr:InlB B-repeat-containing protein [uncultured Ruminococcus sp.]